MLLFVFNDLHLLKIVSMTRKRHNHRLQIDIRIAYGFHWPLAIWYPIFTCTVEPQNAPYTICSLEVHIVYPAYTICSPLNRDMYHTYTICSLAEERSRGRVLDPISMGCGFEPYLKHCVVFLNMTLNILCSVLVSPR